jgi:hypothetical protein
MLFRLSESLFFFAESRFPPKTNENGEIPMTATTKAKSTHRATVSLSLPKSAPALIVYAEGIVKRMTDNHPSPRQCPRSRRSPPPSTT